MKQVRTYSEAKAKARLADPEVQFVDIRDIRELTEGAPTETLEEHRARRRPKG
jgi:hypothetical protein